MYLLFGLVVVLFCSDTQYAQGFIESVGDDVKAGKHYNRYNLNQTQFITTNYLISKPTLPAIGFCGNKSL